MVVRRRGDPNPTNPKKRRRRRSRRTSSKVLSVISTTLTNASCCPGSSGTSGWILAEKLQLIAELYAKIAEVVSIIDDAFERTVSAASSLRSSSSQESKTVRF